MPRILFLAAIVTLSLIADVGAQTPDAEGCSTPGILVGQAIDPANPNPTSDTLTVVDSIILTDVQVLIDMPHAFVGDVEMDVTSPALTTVRLHDGSGTSEDNFDVIYWDLGQPNGLPYDCGGCVMAPTGPGALFDFAGEDSAGDWVLDLNDTFPGSGDGTLENWCVRGFLVSPPAPVSGLACVASTASPGSVDLTWTNPSVYDTIDITVNGNLEATLGGADTSYTTAAGPLPATLEICVTPSIGGTPVVAICCTVDLFVPPVTSLSCSPSTIAGVAEISWDTNGFPYDAIEVSVNGLLEATLAGTDTSFTTAAVAVPSSITVCVEGVLGGGNSAPECCDVVLPADATGEIVLFAGELASTVDSVAAIQDALTSQGLVPVVVTDLGSAGGQPALVWCALGTFPSNYQLTQADGALLASHVQNGVPIIIESNDAWAFDPQTDFTDWDGIDDVLTGDGGDLLQGVIGTSFSTLDLTGFDAAYTQDQPTSTEFTDELVASMTDLAGPSAGPVLMDDTLGGGSGFNVAMFYDTDAPFGKVICQSFEFGGYEGDRNALGAAYTAAVQLGVTGGDLLRRGDANDDGIFDISDPVYGLAALFIPGSDPAPCEDAADANDDGVFDISDQVFSLAALFIPGSPFPPDPGAIDCGTDPSADSLTCEFSSACP